MVNEFAYCPRLAYLEWVQGEFADVLLYSAIPGSESGNMGKAQDFLGTTPEPGTLAMFGSGMIGLAGVLRRRFLP